MISGSLSRCAGGADLSENLNRPSEPRNKFKAHWEQAALCPELQVAACYRTGSGRNFQVEIAAKVTSWQVFEEFQVRNSQPNGKGKTWKLRNSEIGNAAQEFRLWSLAGHSSLHFKVLGSYTHF